MKDSEMYFQCWVEVTKQNRYRDKWLTDETYFRAIKAQFPSLVSLNFNRGSMNRAISLCGGQQLDDFSESNRSGMFRRKAKGVDPFGNPKRYIWGYYVTTPGQVVERPPEGKKCFLSLLQDNSINERYSVARGVAEVVDLTNEITKQSKAKRKAQAQNIAQDESKRARNGPVSGNLVELTYWDSPEAKKLFLGDSNDSRNVVEVLQQRIERLQDANRTMDGWRDVIVRRDIDNLCSAYDIFIIRQRCSILSLAYTVALEEMNSSRWIEDCCGAALNTGSLMGLEAAATSVKTVAAWNILLRANRENFPHPNPRMHQDKKPLPELLEYFQEEIRLPWQQFCIENLSDLTVEMAKDQLMIKIIPSAVESVKKEESTSDNASSNNDEDNKNKNKRLKQDSLLHRYLQSPISSSTTWRWLHSLGFSYSARKKTFFVDGHERQDVLVRRNEFCKEYLTKWEPRCHRWIQVTKEKVEKWRGEKTVPFQFNDKAKGYSYLSPDGVEMVEYHVDDHDFLHEVADEMGFGIMGGNVSERRPPMSKPVIIFGQDECVFNQFLLSGKQWVGPDGHRALLPKTDGMGLMLSAFQSRETGFGMKLSALQLDEINESRRGKNYVDLDAAMAINGQAMKKDLKESPFVVYFELGSNNEGYWTYNHMAIQFEDCVDCLKVVYPHFDFAFLFDHSQGHAKKLPNGLDAYSMNKGFGGVQPQMRESTIKQHNGYLGSHPLTINVGEIQSFTFKSTDDGPFWMSPDQRELNRHDRILPLPPGPPRMQNKTISELKAELAPLGVLNDRRNYRLKELQDIAEQKNVETKKVRVTEKKGWEGRAKGLLQVLWERGWIDVSQLDRYTIEAATDENGQVLEGAEEWSLKCLMASCLDFAEELTALQHVGSQLGVSVIITPKFHAELAGEGVEYSWGITKGLYRRKPLLSKKGKESFRKLVCEVTSRDILKTSTIRKLSRRARAYICAYYSLYESQNRGDTTKLTLPLIERVVKAFKTHRAALDFDAGFVNGFVPSMIDGVIVIDE